jgi:hypothetical protein
MIKSRRTRSAGHVTRLREELNTYRSLVVKSERKRLLARPRYRWEDNIKMGLRETGWGDMDWIDLAQDKNQRRALVYIVMNLLIP